MAFQKTKIDSDLGQEVHKHLVSLGLETPMIIDNVTVDNRTKIEKIESHLSEIVKLLGLDLSDDSLEETPKRIAKMWVLETMFGLEPNNFPKCTTVDDKFKSDQMIKVGDVSVMSLCEHHFVSFIGKAHVAYIPNGKILGLSKINRIVEYYSRRPQVQERLTKQILEALKYVLKTDNVGIVINADHMCVTTRGVSDNSFTTTSALSGTFKDDPTCRSEFMSFVNASQYRK
jgi:GTP cyclohydrolase I